MIALSGATGIFAWSAILVLRLFGMARLSPFAAAACIGIAHLRKRQL
jgi:hypothetical protein